MSEMLYAGIMCGQSQGIDYGMTPPLSVLVGFVDCLAEGGRGDCGSRPSSIDQKSCDIDNEA